MHEIDKIDFDAVKRDLLNRKDVQQALQHGLEHDDVTKSWLRYGGLRWNAPEQNETSPERPIGDVIPPNPGPMVVHGIRMNPETKIAFRLYFQGIEGPIDVAVGSPLAEMLQKVIEADLLKGVISE